MQQTAGHLFGLEVILPLKGPAGRFLDLNGLPRFGRHGEFRGLPEALGRLSCGAGFRLPVLNRFSPGRGGANAKMGYFLANLCPMNGYFAQKTSLNFCIEGRDEENRASFAGWQGRCYKWGIGDFCVQ